MPIGAVTNTKKINEKNIEAEPEVETAAENDIRKNHQVEAKNIITKEIDLDPAPIIIILINKSIIKMIKSAWLSPP